jgi:hypothetical protein
MTIARSAADVLAGHVTLEVECIDQMYLNVYQPRLQHVGGVVSFLRGHLGIRSRRLRWWSRSARSSWPGCTASPRIMGWR